MEKLKIENYLNNEDHHNNYYDPKIMITILEDMFKKRFLISKEKLIVVTYTLLEKI